MKKIVVYTSITENYDRLKKLRVKKDNLKNIDFFYFKEVKEKNDKYWNFFQYPKSLDKYNSIEKNRYVKMLPHEFFPQYEYSLYIDGNIQLIGNIEELINDNKNYLISMFKHTSRNCIYDEAKVCKELGKDDEDRIDKLINMLRREGYPKNNGLNEACIILRQHNNRKIIKAMEEWWVMFRNYSRRDQLSFNYVMWKNGIKVNPLGDSYLHCKNIIKYPHGINRLEEKYIYLKKHLKWLLYKTR